MAVAVAQLAILEVEPAVARDRATPAVAERVADRLLPGSAATKADSGATTAVAERTRPDVPTLFAPVPVEPPVARTSWGGLLFLLHLVSGAVSRTVLHLAGLDLLRRLDPDVDPADPALLAFTGRPPFAAGSWSVTDHDPTENEHQTVRELVAVLGTALDEQIEKRGRRCRSCAVATL